MPSAGCWRCSAPRNRRRPSSAPAHRRASAGRPLRPSPPRGRRRSRRSRTPPPRAPHRPPAVPRGPPADSPRGMVRSQNPPRRRSPERGARPAAAASGDRLSPPGDKPRDTILQLPMTGWTAAANAALSARSVSSPKPARAVATSVPNLASAAWNPAASSQIFGEACAAGGIGAPLGEEAADGMRRGREGLDHRLADHRAVGHLVLHDPPASPPPPPLLSISACRAAIGSSCGKAVVASASAPIKMGSLPRGVPPSGSQALMRSAAI